MAQARPRLLPEYFDELSNLDAQHRKVGTGLEPLDRLLRRHGDGPVGSVFFNFAAALYRAGLQPAAAYLLGARSAHTVHSINPLSMHYVPISVPARTRELWLHVDTVKRSQLRVSVVVGGPKGRQVTANPIHLRSEKERQHVLLLITSGTAGERYDVRVKAEQ